MRINKFLASTGLGSRRKCEEYVRQGRVTVDGKVASSLAFDIAQKSVVCVDGKQVKRIESYDYIMMHKPKGYITAVVDDRGRKTVMELLPENFKHLKPIGRLDYNSEGLLLFTNDGDLAQKIMRPSFHVEKVYLVKLEGEIKSEDIQKISEGVELVDGTKFLGATISDVEIGDRKSKLKIQLVEGKNREIRKIFSNFGYNVIFLKRISIGEIKLGGLTRGKVRKLNDNEIKYLKSIK